MLDVRTLREDTAAIAAKLRKKGYELPVAEFQALEASRRSLQQETERLQSERNARSKEIGVAKSRGEDIQPLVAAVGDLGDRLDATKEEFDTLQTQLQAFLSEIPNVPDDSVPEGDSENDNIELSQWGDLPEFTFEPQDHVALTEGGGMDFEVAAKISGARFVVMHKGVARLHRALIQFMLDTHIEQHGYAEVYVPYMVNADSMYGTGQLPKFDNGFMLDQETPTYLIPTAEVPVTNLYRDVILDAAELPVRHVCHTPCFRSEAGSYGKDTRGIIRQHQFEKVELVHIVHPDQSWQALDELTSHAEAILQALALPYRVMALCGGDLGFSAAKTIDLEVWLPGQQKYREISSCSNFLDFQARRMLARYRDPDTNKPAPVHTLNGSGLAVGRTLVAILENYQDANGRVAIPTVLQPYMHGATQLEF